MKVLFSIGLLLASFSSASSAHAWENFVNCNNGAVALDYETNKLGEVVYQMVVRYSALDYFTKMNGISITRVNDKKEYIVSVRYKDGAFRGYDENYSNMEYTNFTVGVDHAKKTVQLATDRLNYRDEKPFQHVQMSFANCFTK